MEASSVSDAIHIVIITPIFAVDEKDSINLPFLQIFCRELIKTNIHITVISEQYPQHNDYTWHGRNVITLKRNTSRFAYKFLRQKRLLRALTTIHKKRPITLIHNFWFNILACYSEKFALRHKIKHLVTLTGQDILPENKYIQRITKYSGELVCPSEFHKKKLLEYYEVDPKIIGWGIENVSPTYENRDIDLIVCGWINTVKNYPLVLAIAKELQKTGIVNKIVICGGGPLLADMIRDTNRLGLNSLIEIKNSIQRNEVMELMQRSKLLVHTSHFESFGLVLAEALACNCKVVSTPVGIAFDDPRIITCETTASFISAITFELENYKDPGPLPVNPYPVEKTVRDYLEIYKQPTHTSGPKR